ncbi:MAG: gamma carbonic anhydrase family protein [Candidatus Baldrarchaeia archaeon]
MPIYEFRGKKPKIDKTAFVHPDAVIIGDVVIGSKVFIAPCAVLRGDNNRITIGECSNVQDNVVIHTEPEFETIIGRYVNIGHGAVIHAHIIEDYVAIGMNAVLDYKSIVRRGAIVGNGAVVTAFEEVPEDTIVVGVPARPLRKVKGDDDPARAKIREFVNRYLKFTEEYRKYLRQVRLEEVTV